MMPSSSTTNGAKDPVAASQRRAIPSRSSWAMMTPPASPSNPNSSTTYEIGRDFSSRIHRKRATNRSASANIKSQSKNAWHLGSTSRSKSPPPEVAVATGETVTISIFLNPFAPVHGHGPPSTCEDLPSHHTKNAVKGKVLKVTIKYTRLLRFCQ